MAASGSGLAPTVANTGLTTAPSSTGIGSGASNTTISGAAPGAQTGITGGAGGQGSFLDNLLSKGRSMMNNRFFTDAAGRVISGFAQGQSQQAAMDWKQQQIDAARANARFGNVGSRYNTAGMMGPATYSK